MPDNAERTEPGTPKRRREARGRGEVARSAELSSSVNLLVGLAAISMSGVYLYHQLGRFLLRTFVSLPSGELGTGEWLQILTGALRETTQALAPILGAILAAALLVNYLQVGFQMSSQVLAPKWDRINPLSGAKRLFSLHGWVELLKASLKIALTSWIVWADLKKSLPGLIHMTGSSLETSLAAAGAMFWSICWKIGLFFIVLGAADYAWQRFDYLRKLRMSRQEVRDEMRETEGDPQVRGRQRSRHRKMSQTRMASEVAKADVVTINPTHYAVALRYDVQRMRAPRVVAKGQRLWAKLIVRIARRNRVPVIQNKPVTRMLYSLVEVGEEIPPTLYRAVAEILAALYRIRARKGGPK